MRKEYVFRVSILIIVSIFLGNTCGYSNASTIDTRILVSENKPELKAFPGAEGFGTDTPGGRGGKVFYVTSLADSGPGTLREALTDAGHRTILFNISGTITLESDIIVYYPYVTIAGQTAPGEGIQIRGAQIIIKTHDVIIRYLKVRSGDEQNSSSTSDRDAITLNDHLNAFNIVIDHSSLTWGSDIGGLTFLNGARDSTVSYSIIGEGLYLSNHPEARGRTEGHSMAMNITELDSQYYPKRITVHHNLLTTSADRNPRIIGGENIDFVNNVIYNWKFSASQGNPRSVNLINNYYIPGPMTTMEEYMVAWQPKVEAGGNLRSETVFEDNNFAEGFDTIRGAPKRVYVETRFEPYSIINEDSPRRAYSKVVLTAGANKQVANSNGRFRKIRDEVDKRIIKNLVKREGSFFNGMDYGGRQGFDAISWPELSNGEHVVDSDLDGMPDQWEMKYFGDLLRGSALDSSSDYDGDGYTDLEEYLNGTDPLEKDTNYGAEQGTPYLLPAYPAPTQNP